MTNQQAGPELKQIAKLVAGTNSIQRAAKLVAGTNLIQRAVFKPRKKSLRRKLPQEIVFNDGQMLIPLEFVKVAKTGWVSEQELNKIAKLVAGTNSIQRVVKLVARTNLIQGAIFKLG